MVQLIYTSRLVFDASTPEGWSLIEDIVARAHERNTRNGITGFLLVGKDWVAQILEGENARVNTTFHRILSDPRHTDIRLIDVRIITRRKFDGWAMGASRRPMSALPPQMSAHAVGFAPVSFEAILAMARDEAA
ncbi:MAG: BLUF domain-containing protein [Proteobacteria bacterium]|nr:BLUF domain-containing protein [Pseudomonadota bacterium]